MEKVSPPELLTQFREEIKAFYDQRERGECLPQFQGKSDALIMIETYEGLVENRRKMLASSGNIYTENPLIPSTVPIPEGVTSYLDSTEIRLLVFEPQALEGPLYCSMILWDIEISNLEGEALQGLYHTLSYRWNESGESTTLVVDGHNVEISFDLDLALRSILKSQSLNASQDRLILWVDAVCINQKDDRERTQQVAVMSHIYSCCRICLIWLGPMTDDSGCALDLMESVFEACKASQDHDDPDSSSLWRTLRMIEIQERQHFAIEAFFSRPFWERLWIVQEILLSREKLVFCGERSFDWKWLGTFTHLYLTACSSEGLAITMQTRGQKARDLVQLDKMYDRRKRFRLIEGLFISQNRKSSDMRDAVFAILGVVHANGLRPRYHRFATDAMIEAAMRIMDQDRSFNVFSMAHVEDPEARLKRWDTTLKAVQMLLKYRPKRFDELLDCNLLTEQGHNLDRIMEEYQQNLSLNLTDDDFARATWVSWCPPRQGDISCLPTWAPDWSGTRPMSSHILFYAENGELKKRKFATTPVSFPSYWNSSPLSGRKLADTLPEAIFGLKIPFGTTCFFVDTVEFSQVSNEKGDVINTWLIWNHHLDSISEPPYTTPESRAAAFASTILLKDREEPIKLGDAGQPLGAFAGICRFLMEQSWKLSAVYGEKLVSGTNS